MSWSDYIPSIEFVPEWIKQIYRITYLIVAIILLSFIHKRKIKSDNNTFLTIIFISFYTFFSVFYCINSDYFAYRFWVENYEMLISYFSKEMIYLSIAKIVNSDYELFRIVVWGGAIVITTIGFRFQKVKLYPALLIWFVFYYNQFCYARASLGMSILFVGISNLCLRNEGKYRLIVGLSICLLSILFHRSLFICILTLPIIFFKINKTRLVLYSLLLVGTATLAMNYIETGEIADDAYLRTIQNYSSRIEESEYVAHSLSNYIKQIWNYSQYYLVYFVILKVILNKRTQMFIAEETYSMFKVTTGIILVASAFFFEFGGGNIFFYRILFVTASMLAALLCRLYQDGLISQRTIYILCFNTISYHVVYMIVNASTH